MQNCSKNKHLTQNSLLQMLSKLPMNVSLCKRKLTNRTPVLHHHQLQHKGTNGSLLQKVCSANTDTSFDESRSICAIGIILRDDQGIIRSDVARILPAISIIHSEALALKEAHILATNLGIKHISFESDNQDLVAICKDKAKHWQIC